MTPEQQQVAALRAQLWRHGFRPLACLTADKVPSGRDWPERARQTPPECLRFDPVSFALNTGLLADGLRPIDIDVDDAALAERVAGVVVALLGPAPVRYRSNSARRCLLYRAAEGQPPKRIVGGEHGKVEFLGRGQQLLAFGVHPTGVALEWTVSPAEQITLGDLPAVTETQITELLAALALLLGAPTPKPNGGDDTEHVAGEPQADFDRIAEALAQIPNAAAPDWEWWNRLGMALWAATGGSDDGLVLWLTWSARHPSFDEKETRARWRNYHRSPPDALGAGTIFRLAQEATREQLEGWFDPGPAAGEAKPETPPGAGPWAQAAQPQAAEPDEPEIDDDWPEPVSLAGFHGPIGKAVSLLMPETEADQQALLFQLLAFIGNRIGRGPHYPVKKARHGCNLFVLLAGATSRARKGTSETEIRSVFEVNAADPWLQTCIQSGLSSGEGVIHAVRDASYELNKKTGALELTDAGVADKRLLIVESEFASPLAVMKRQGNTLSPVLRRAWDSGRLQIMTKNTPARATGALISIVGHITIDELRGEVDRIAISNGFLNRFLFAVVKRARKLPFGGEVDQAKLDEVGWELAAAVEAARLIDAVTMSEPARGLWKARYDALSSDHTGLFGSLISRSEAQTARLALIYALMDQSAVIEPVHLEAALAVWRYSEDSARLLFGPLVGDQVADSLLVFLKGAGTAGMTRTELYNAMGRNTSSARIQLALQLLLKQGRVRRGAPTRAGRAGPFTEIWVHVRRTGP